MMNLYQYKLKHSLDKLDKREDEVIYRAYLYELSEEAMLKNLIYSKGKSPLLITNGSYIYDPDPRLINYPSFYYQYSKINVTHGFMGKKKGSLYIYIAYQPPFSNLNAIEIYGKASLPIIIERPLKFIHDADIIVGDPTKYRSVLILNEYQVPPLVFVIEADAIDVGIISKSRPSNYRMKKYSTIDLIESLQSQEATYQEIEEYLLLGGSGINIEQLQQKKQNQIEQAYQNYETYLQTHNEELLLKSLEKDQDRNNINNLVKTLRKTYK